METQLCVGLSPHLTFYSKFLSGIEQRRWRVIVYTWGGFVADLIIAIVVAVVLDGDDCINGGGAGIVVSGILFRATSKFNIRIMV